MSVVTPEIRFFADCHWLMADNIILLRITPMLPYEWSNLRRLFDCKSTFETRSGPFDYWRIRLEFDGNLIHWTVSDGWWHPKTTTFDTDYETTMTVLFDVGYDQWRKDRGIMDEADKAVKRLNDSGIPATRSSDPDYLVFEVGESVFRALLPADPTHAASRLIAGRFSMATGRPSPVLAGSRHWRRMTCTGMTCSRTATRSKPAPSYSKAKVRKTIPSVWTC